MLYNPIKKPIFEQTNCDEVWMPVKGHPSYHISNLGRIKSHKRIPEIFMNPFINGKGYLRIELDDKSYSVHRLVLIHYKPIEGMELLQGNHKNLIKTDNRDVNLEWNTNQENSDHSWANGRKAVRGSKQGSSKLTEADVREIKHHLCMGNYTQSKLSEMYGVCKSTIGKIATGKNWSWL